MERGEREERKKKKKKGSVSDDEEEEERTVLGRGEGELLAHDYPIHTMDDGEQQSERPRSEQKSE